MEIIYLYILLFCLYYLYELLNRIIICIEKVINGNTNIIFNIHIDDEIFGFNVRELIRRFVN